MNLFIQNRVCRETKGSNILLYILGGPLPGYNNKIVQQLSTIQKASIGSIVNFALFGFIIPQKIFIALAKEAPLRKAREIATAACH